MAVAGLLLTMERANGHVTMHFAEQLAAQHDARFPDRLGLMARSVRLVRQAISEMPGESGEVVPLFAAGCEYREITGMLGIADSAVRSVVSPAGKWPS